MDMRIGVLVLVFIITTFGFNQQGFIGFSTAQAQEEYEDNTKSKRKTKKTGAMTEKVAKKLQVAQEAIEAEQLEEGIEILNEILELRRLTDYERAQVNYFFAYVAYLKEDYRGAINYYSKVLQEEEVPEGLLSSARYTIAQLWFQLEEWEKAIRAVDDLLVNSESPRPDLYILKGSALYQLKKYTEMIPVIRAAIDLSEQRNPFRIQSLQGNIKSVADENRVTYDKSGETEINYPRLVRIITIKLKEDLTKLSNRERDIEQKKAIEESIVDLDRSVANLAIGPTKENWWLLLRAAHFELDDIKNVRVILERLLIEWPKKEYWTQLSAIYGQLHFDDKQISSYRTAYEEGFLVRSNELVQMAQLYLSMEVPYKAAVILQKGVDAGQVDLEVKNWRLLSQAWFLAQDDQMAIAALREAAKLSDDGELDIRLARSLANTANFEGCVNSATTAIGKGDLKRDDESYITLGMCQFEVASYEDSKESFGFAEIDAERRKELALDDCAANEEMTKANFVETLEKQAQDLKKGKEIEDKILSCILPASLRTVNNWQTFLEKEVARVTQLQSQMRDIEEQLKNRESQAISF
tara:strand:- start:2557 stop:4302 length:1746 start_codon:yes stop_codon:yes gene_type:complete